MPWWKPSRDVPAAATRSEEHTSELQLRENLVCRLLLEKKKQAATNRLNVVMNQSAICYINKFVNTYNVWSNEPPSQAGNVFFFNDTATTEIYTLSLHDALPI